MSPSLATRAGVALGGAAAATWCAPALAPLVPAVAGAIGVPRRIDVADGVAVTFDDGPHPEGTPRVLEALAAADAKATFFLCGEQVERHPGMVREIAAAGHAIALHGHRHRNLLRLSPRAFVTDLERGIAVLEEAIGSRPTLYRPPYGIFTLPGLAEVRARGLRPLLWSRWGHDWRGGRTPGKIAAEATQELASGDVLLLHDADHYSAAGSWRGTAAALPWILAAIEQAGLRAVPVPN